MPINLTEQQKDEKLRQHLDPIRQSWMPIWTETNEYLAPMQALIFRTNQNKGTRRNQAIINSVPVLADRAMAAGFFTHMTPATRPWIFLGIEDDHLAEDDQVKAWLYYHQQLAMSLLARTNFYPKIFRHYMDAGDYATAVTLMEKDADMVVRFTTVPVGTFWITKNNKGEHDICYRELRYTCHKMVEEFGRKEIFGEIQWDYFSAEVRKAYEEGNIMQEFDIIHVVKPNPDHKPGSPIGKFMRFKSCWYEKGTKEMPSQAGKYLRESGFNRFPFAITLWNSNDEDDYGTMCPAMQAWGDIKELYELTKRQNQAVDKSVKPPMVGPAALERRPEGVSHHAGAFTPDEIGSGDPKNGLRPLYQVSLDLNHLNQKIEKIEEHIEQAFYLDLFLMLANLDRKDITATEIIERKEEKLLALGPVAMFFMKTLRDVFDFFWESMMEQGYVLPAPPQMANAKIKVEFVNLFEQAQKAASLSGMERLLSYTERIAAVEKALGQNRIGFKVNLGEMADIIQKIANLPPELVNSDEKADALQAKAAQQQNMMNQVEALKTAAETGKTLSETPLDTGSALDQLLQQGAPGQMAGAGAVAP